MDTRLGNRQQVSRGLLTYCHRYLAVVNRATQGDVNGYYAFRFGFFWYNRSVVEALVIKLLPLPGRRSAVALVHIGSCNVA